MSRIVLLAAAVAFGSASCLVPETPHPRGVHGVGIAIPVPVLDLDLTSTSGGIDMDYDAEEGGVALQYERFFAEDRAWSVVGAAGAAHYDVTSALDSGEAEATVLSLDARRYFELGENWRVFVNGGLSYTPELESMDTGEDLGDLLWARVGLGLDVPVAPGWSFQAGFEYLATVMSAESSAAGPETETDLDGVRVWIAGVYYF